MRVLVRHITRKSQAGVGHADREVQADALTIGRGTDADVFLSDLHVALHHAVLRQLSEGRFTVQARTPSGIKINGRTTQTGLVRPGDTVGVGLSTLRLQCPGDDYDLVIEVEEAAARTGEEAETGATSLAQTGLGKRRWAWLLFLAMLVVGLGVPLGHVYRERGRGDAVRQGETGGALPALGRRLVEGVPWTLVGGDRLWDSGPMSRAHRFFGQECRQCHREPFQRVTNAACLDCHEGQPHHADEPALMRASGLSGRRCASCHREHSGMEALVAADTTLCTDCHDRPGRNMPGTDVHPVAGFVDDRHPQFRVRLVSLADDATFGWRRVRMRGPISEGNGLVFPHDVHLADDGIRGRTGKERLVCGDCHRPGPEGVAMQPVRFERACRRCHRLNFEPADPDREVPHGDPKAVIDTLESYYARVALAGGFDSPEAEPPEVVRRQRPSARELDERERRAALAWAQARADEVATEIFEYRTCKTCHAVARSAASTSGWRVRPVAMTQDWFPHARFTHARHGQMACTDCHDAAGSESASDVLMPRLATCQRCHGEPGSRARVASRCIDCHGFHAADRLEMGPARAELVDAER